ncbi:hypothetical protein RvY_00373 [Ramazzottius varieornatus]|uniref:Uncharacterized protein n=1 Tax=Ramazzottius varieornatus TaxID=947166 RepID=A0A1D1UMH4_RAMVA|nr:hypothetical protein RvY_00373 [Ramazzottius varieornatus]
MGRGRLSNANKEIGATTATVIHGLRSRAKAGAVTTKKLPASVAEDGTVTESIQITKNELAKVEKFLIVKATQSEAGTSKRVLDAIKLSKEDPSRKIRKKRPARRLRRVKSRRLKQAALQAPKGLQDELSTYFKPANAKRR